MTSHYECFIPDCAKTFSHCTFLDHVKEHHPDNFVPKHSSPIRIECKESTKGDVCYFHCYGQLFKGRCWFNSEGGISFSVWLCPEKKHSLESPDHYKYEVKVVHPKSPEKTIVFGGNCNTYGNYSSISRVDFNQITPFVIDDSVKFKYTIRKV